MRFLLFISAITLGVVANAAIAPELATICKQYYNLDQQTACLKEMNDKTIDPAALGICKQYYNLDQQVDCVKKLANQTFDQTAISVCKQYYNLDQQVTCLQKFVQPVSPTPAKGYVRAQLQRAVSLLRAGNSSDSELILGGLINKLDNEPGLCQ